MERSLRTERAGERQWGADKWRLMKRRVDALMAAPTLLAMDGVPGQCHQLRADRAGEFAVYLWSPYRLVFVPDHDPIPRLHDGRVNRSLVTQIVITEVVDYHGD